MILTTYSMFIIFYYLYFVTVKEIYDDMTKLLPSNCQYAVTQWKQSFAEVEGIFHSLSQTYDDHVPLYENLLPFVLEKCGYKVLEFIDVAMRAIRDEKKKKKMHELRNGNTLMMYVYTNFVKFNNIIMHIHMSTILSNNAVRKWFTKEL